MAGIKIVDLPALGRDLASTDLLELSLAGGTGSRKISGQEIMNASKLNVGTTSIINGGVGRLLFQGAGDVLQESTNLYWDTSITTLNILGNASLNNLFTTGNVVLDTANVWLSNGYAIGEYSTGNNRIEFYTTKLSLITNGNDVMTLLNSGNVLIGTTTDSGYKLDVNGTARFSNQVTFGQTLNVGGNLDQISPSSNSGNFDFISNLPIRFLLKSGSVERMRIVSSTGNVLINTTTDNGYKLEVNGTARFSGLLTTTLSNINATHTGATIRGMYIVNNADSIVRAGLQFDGNTAYVELVGRYNNGAAFLRQDGSNGDISFLRTTSEYLRIFGATGNVAINTTTDAGYKLDVNGTTRMVGNLTFSTTNWVLDSANAVMYRSAFNTESIAFNLSRMVFTDGNGFVFNGSNSAATLTTSSIVDIQSTTKGFLPPRMTNAQRIAIATPAVGLIVYCTDALEGLYIYKSGGWTFII